MMDSALVPFPAAYLPRTLQLFLSLLHCSCVVDFVLMPGLLSHDSDHVLCGFTSSHVNYKYLGLWLFFIVSIFLIWPRDTLKHTLSNC